MVGVFGKYVISAWGKSDVSLFGWIRKNDKNAPKEEALLYLPLQEHNHNTAWPQHRCDPTWSFPKQRLPKSLSGRHINLSYKSYRAKYLYIQDFLQIKNNLDVIY